MAVGGAAYLVSKAISEPRSSPSPISAWRRSTSSTSRTCRSPSPSTRSGTSVHDTGPREWQRTHRQDSGRRRVTAAGRPAQYARQSWAGAVYAAFRVARAPRRCSPRMTTSANVSASTCPSRGGHGHDAQSAARANRAPDEAQPAHRSASSPHRDRDHGRLRLAAMARRQRASLRTQGAHRASSMLAELAAPGSPRRQQGADRADPRGHRPTAATSRMRSPSLDNAPQTSSPSADVRPPGPAHAALPRRCPTAVTSRPALRSAHVRAARARSRVISAIVELASTPVFAQRPGVTAGRLRPARARRSSGRQQSFSDTAARRAYRRGAARRPRRRRDASADARAWSRRCAG